MARSGDAASPAWRRGARYQPDSPPVPKVRRCGRPPGQTTGPEGGDEPGGQIALVGLSVRLDSLEQDAERDGSSTSVTLPVVPSPQRNPKCQTQFRPLITVVIAVRNGADMLQRCLDSIFEQRYDRVELVVMDGASSDGTQAILERNTSRIHYWETEPDRGIYHAWNKALDHTHGDWICFLGADDRYRDPDALGRMATALTEDGGRHRIAYTTLDIVDHAGAVIRTLGMPWDLARRDVQSGMSLPHPSTFYHRSFFEEHGRFDESFAIAGDYEMVLRELLASDALFLPGPAVVEMALGGVSDRQENHVTRTREDERARRMHGLTRVPAALSLPLFRARIGAWLTRTFGPWAAGAVAAAYRSIVYRGRR